MAIPDAPYITQDDLAASVSPGTFLQLFDDDNVGTISSNDVRVAQVLRRAHAQLISRLPRAYDTLPESAPELLYSAELDYAIVFSFERHPEFAKTYGTEQRAAAWKRAETIMENVANAIQILTDNAPADQPATEGVLIFDPNPRHVICDSADGTRNSGDF